ncbi:MAG TPA: hypothetical protein VF261_01630 [Candidatus Saccharimonadales bacterium]
MTILSELSTPSAEQLRTASLAVLGQLEEEGYVDPHKVRRCRDVSSMIVATLCELEVPGAEVASGSTPGVLAHAIVATGDEVDAVIADATWQQFLPAGFRSPLGLPRVLVGTRSDVAQLAVSYGVPDGMSDLWPNCTIANTQVWRRADRAAAEAAQAASDELWAQYIPPDLASVQ